MRLLTGHTNTVEALAYSRNGNLLASGGRDRSIRIWDTGTGRCQAVFKGVTDGWVRDVAWSIDDNSLCIIDSDRGVRVWDTTRAKEAWLLAQNQFGLYFRSAYSPDGRLLVACFGGGGPSEDSPDYEEGSIKIWQTKNFAQNPKRIETFASSLTFSNNGGLLVSGGGKHIELWDTANFKKAWSWTTQSSVSALAFAPDNRVLAAAEAKGMIVLDIDKRCQIASLPRQRKSIEAVAFAPDGQHMITGGNDGVVAIWQTETWERVTTFEFDLGKIRCLAIAPDGLTAVAGGERGRLIQWDLEVGD